MKSSKSYDGIEARHWCDFEMDGRLSALGDAYESRPPTFVGIAEPEWRFHRKERTVKDRLDHLHALAHSHVVAIEMEVGELRTAQELETQAKMLCSSLHAEETKYSEAMEVLTEVEDWLEEHGADGAGSDDEPGLTGLLGSVRAVLAKGGG